VTENKNIPDQKSDLSPQRIGYRDIVAALGSGWRTFRQAPAASIGYASVAALIGLVLLTASGYFGISPMALPLAGGFLLVGPAVLAGFFRIARILEQGGRPGLADPFIGLFRAPAGVWLMATFCLFMFLIWITDAGVVYAFLIGAKQLPQALPWLVRPSSEVLAFWGWSSLMGSVLAFIVFTVTAFSVPLLLERRANLVTAVHASVRAVFKSFLPCLAWALFLGIAVIGAVVLLPLLPVVLPLFAYAGLALHRSIFP
jgi:uncharacterized membrane protein